MIKGYTAEKGKKRKINNWSRWRNRKKDCVHCELTEKSVDLGMEMVNALSYLASDVQMVLHVVSSLDFLQPNSTRAFFCTLFLHIYQLARLFIIFILTFICLSIYLYPCSSQFFYTWRYTTHSGCVFYSPLSGFSLLAYEVTWSHTATPHSR